jgi:hypothetical protein
MEPASSWPGREETRSCGGSGPPGDVAGEDVAEVGAEPEWAESGAERTDEDAAETEPAAEPGPDPPLVDSPPLTELPFAEPVGLTERSERDFGGSSSLGSLVAPGRPRPNPAVDVVDGLVVVGVVALPGALPTLPPVWRGARAAAMLALPMLGTRFPMSSRRSETRRGPVLVRPAVLGSRLGSLFPTRPPRAYDPWPSGRGTGAGALDPPPRFSNLAIRSLSEPETCRCGGAAPGDVGRLDGRELSDLCVSRAVLGLEWAENGGWRR